ncbi:GntR family transcriptional regulator [Terrabacter sp. MAHUQ-38]|uniref:GntR family transcriptional regulator n=1 Tax=unclassified Terrabacter TaxID=2630222 RepID=UPI00165E1694|nr:winged helix-turn-helix domain-containing protein [Terrabacter sp. MAHUQ-38]MBC9819721.1 winged helix-turn-helix transcriptional regulator [Terrabacter sp. MAHUQ-38]
MELDMDDPRPSYLQLAARLRAAVTDGTYAVGARLPSVRTLADEYGVATATAAKAMDVLKRDGIVQGRPGFGTVVREAPSASRSSTASLQEQVDDLRRRVEALEGAAEEG